MKIFSTLVVVLSAGETRPAVFLVINRVCFWISLSTLYSCVCLCQAVSVTVSVKQMVHETLFLSSKYTYHIQNNTTPIASIAVAKQYRTQKQNFLKKIYQIHIQVQIK